ncbi:MAG: DnaJ domain-containing protein [Planctomycetes bacterium]|nr:DnaJ domain-containing protein [Planctomycetota bacterium]
MSADDYYKVLNVKRGATHEEIRTAYRRLARKYHPDVSDRRDAQARFTEIQEAYDVLSDDKKRRLYDAAGPAAVGGPGRPHGNYTWSNVGGGQGVGVDFDLDDMGTMFETFFGGRGDFGRPRARPSRAARRKGRDLEKSISIPFIRAVEGGTERVQVGRGASAATIDVKIPAGIAHGAKLRVAGKGEPGQDGTSHGDLILIVSVQEHPLYRREHASPLNLHLDLPLTVEEALAGSRIVLPAPRSNVELTVPAGTSGGTTLRVRGRGIKARSERGDLLVHTRIVLPRRDPDGKLISAAGIIAAATDNPRTGPDWD